ncbi:proline-rich transmembrane protein 3 isoform X1 [Neopelma chrysocephalum]|uniref:proline-rich transmembrane protein 3 isoform X1 n=1 Tax=Neopelma chrysocephalum TaxID=114329 RepID=UPI000FCD4A59|nr:proline-rich transmembrane protein 3 isoform X1 [Neopelma chrysocephalum]
MGPPGMGTAGKRAQGYSRRDSQAAGSLAGQWVATGTAAPRPVARVPRAAAVGPGSQDPHPRRASWVLTMAAAQLVTWGMLLATVVPAGAQGVLPEGMSLGGDPLHSAAWGQQWPGPSPTWEASGEPSGTGDSRSERRGGNSPVHWSPPLQAGHGTGAPLKMETTMTGADTRAWRDGSTALAVTEEPLVTWRGHEAEGQDSPVPHSSAPGTLGPGVPTDTGPPWVGQGLSLSGQNATKTAGTPSPWSTVSTIALNPLPAVGMGTADAHTGGQTMVEGPTAALGLPQDAQLAPASSQSVPLGTVPASHPTGTGPTQRPHTSRGSAQPVSSWGDTGGPSSPSLALPNSAPQLPHITPSWGLAEPWTRGLPSHQRSTRRAPLSHTTTSPGDAAPRTDPRMTGQRGPQPTPGAVLSTSPAPLPASSTATPGTSSTGLLPEEDVGSPQQVRGAVGAVSIPNATKATPQPAAHPSTTGTLGTRNSGTPGTQPPIPGTATPSATWRRAGVTPQPAPRNPSLLQPQPQPSRAPPVPGANGTGLRWAELQHELGFSWEAHVYGLAAIFLLLALGCLAGLAGTAILRPPHLPHTVGAHGLLLAACLLRATFLLLDPYGARGRLPALALLLLSTAPFPLLLAAFALLLQRLQRLAQLRLLPARLRGLPALGAVAALQSVVLGAADLLPPRLGPAALGLQALGCVAGALLLLGGLWGCWRVLRAPCEEPGPRPGARALLAAAVAGLPVCGLQLYSAVWLRGVLGPPGRFSRPGWVAQLWLRIGELGTALALLATTAEPVCCQCHRQSPAGHSCWAKALRYFCAGRKAEAPEYPNNCYDWAGGSASGTSAERTPANDISKSLIRNPAEQLPLRALKDSNEAWAAGAGIPGLSPKCPNLLAARSCATFEQGSSPSLGELVFRPPSPIDLRRSIDQALCRRHLLQDSLFSRPRRGSGTSLHGSPAPSPGLGRMVRCSSLTELPGPRQPPGTITVTVTASASSLESSSLKISWNPWRHGLSSPDSLPLDEAPSRAPLLVPAGPPGWEREGPRSLPALGKAVDSRSLSSDTIEL